MGLPAETAVGVLSPLQATTKTEAAGGATARNGLMNILGFSPYAEIYQWEVMRAETDLATSVSSDTS